MRHAPLYPDTLAFILTIFGCLCTDCTVCEFVCLGAYSFTSMKNDKALMMSFREALHCCLVDIPGHTLPLAYPHIPCSLSHIFWPWTVAKIGLLWCWPSVTAFALTKHFLHHGTMSDLGNSKNTHVNDVVLSLPGPFPNLYVMCNTMCIQWNHLMDNSSSWLLIWSDMLTYLMGTNRVEQYRPNNDYQSR